MPNPVIPVTLVLVRACGMSACVAARVDADTAARMASEHQDELWAMLDYYFEERPRHFAQNGRMVSVDFNRPSNVWMEVISGGGVAFVEKDLEEIVPADLPSFFDLARGLFHGVPETLKVVRIAPEVCDAAAAPGGG